MNDTFNRKDFWNSTYIYYIYKYNFHFFQSPMNLHSIAYNFFITSDRCLKDMLRSSINSTQEGRINLIILDRQTSLKDPFNMKCLINQAVMRISTFIQ